ncbi:DUF3850 domain-containing protein, partial [Serratia sp. CY74664]|uniref:DUF3850 domain-containing protein n=1 Tax=Serratia sp. CY74664 TaxID=3383676 RepID=UPI003F9FD367
MTITPQQLIALLPLLIVGLTVVVVMLGIAWRRDHLKIHPEHLAAVNCGAKRAEFRINDRDFAVGD